MGQRADRFAGDHAAPIQNLLKFGRRLRSLMRSEKRFAANVDGIKICPEGAVARNAQLVGRRSGQRFYGFRSVARRIEIAVCACRVGR